MSESDTDSQMVVFGVVCVCSLYLFACLLFLPAQKPLLRSTAVSSQSLLFCPGRFGGAAQHMIRRNSKLLSALMIVTQWVFFAAESGRPAIAGKREARTSWWRGLLEFFYSSRVSIPGYG